LLRCNGRQRLRICLRISDEVTGLLSAAVLPIPVFLFFINQGVLIRLAALAGGFLMAARLVLYAIIRTANRRGWLAEKTLIVGTGQLGTEIKKLLQEHPELGLMPVGFVGSTAISGAPSVLLLGEVYDLPDLVASYNISRIIVTPPGESDADIVSVLRVTGQLSAEVSVVPRMYELASAIPGRHRDDIWGIPLIPLRRSGLSRTDRIMKRTFDIVAGTLLLCVFAPVILLLMAGVVLSCGRPALFRQTRVTGSGRLMKITKLRTVARTDLDGSWAVTAADCSALGRWLRATHLDELPQLLNVIRGEMSLVGPRPERPYFVSQFTETVPGYDDRHRANAGMTGWAQVHGLTGDTSIDERARFDNNYIEHWSLWLDLVILVRTLAQPLSGIRQKD
jgi:exopolysaccharide biosynthesis polyprenyl glycosylphosphotransferase